MNIPTKMPLFTAFAVPMKVSPELTVEFYDVNLTAEVTHCTTYEVRFRVRGAGGYKREWVPVQGLLIERRSVACAVSPFSSGATAS
jgi:hypothetical protein